jgi:predicted nucleotidyltransferase component of viral defense system
LPYLKAFKTNWYLAGGTALALQIGHRESIDFDFFQKNEFDTEKLFQEVKHIFPSAQKTFTERNTLYIDVDTIKISFIQFPYKQLEPFLETDILRIAHPRDIAAMKLSAIQQRSTKKDYIDIYFLLQNMSIDELCSCYFEKF